MRTPALPPDKCLLSAYQAPDTAPGNGESKVRAQKYGSHAPYIPVGKTGPHKSTGLAEITAL